MNLTFTHAQYSNPGRTAVVAQTVEAGAVLITIDDPLWPEMLAACTPTDPPDAVVSPAVPAVVTPRQARLALHQVGRLADVAAAIAGMPEPARTSAQIEWEFASVVERASPLVATLGAALDLSDAELDDLFITAGGL